MKDLIKKPRQSLYRFLRWSQKYTKTDMIYLTKGMSWLTIGQVVSSLAGFTLAVAFANLLPKETFGTYKFVLSLAAIVAIPTLPGINISLVRAISKGQDKTFFRAKNTKVRWSLASAAASLAVAIYYVLNDNFTLSLSFVIAALLLPLMESLSIYSSILQGKKLFKKIALSESAGQIFSVTTILAALFITDNLYAILIVYFVSWILVRLTIYLLSKKHLNENTDENENIVSLGKHLTIMKSFGIIAEHLDKILLFHFLGPMEVAIYSFAIIIPERLKGLLKNAYNLALPKFSSRNPEEIKKELRRKMIWIEGVLALITLVYILVAPLFFKIFFPQYLNAVIFSQIFSISLLTMVIFIPMAFLNAQASRQQLYVYNISTSIIQILFLLIGAAYFGIWGIISARILGRAVSFVVATILSYKI